MVKSNLGRYLNGWFIHILAALLVGIFVFYAAPDTQYNEVGGDYVVWSDSPSYYNFYWSPWDSSRSPGYPLFLSIFLHSHREQLKNILEHLLASSINLDREVEQVLKTYNEAGLRPVFDRVAHAQQLLLAISSAALVFACSFYFNGIISACLFFAAVFAVPLVNPYFILSESLAQPLTFLALSALLIFNKFHKFAFLFIACFLSAYVFLVRPVGLYMLCLCAAGCAYFLWQSRFRQILRYFAAFAGFLPAICYFGAMNLTAGHLTFGTMSHWSHLMTICYYLKEEDIGNMPTYRAKRFAELYLAQLPAFENTYIREHIPGYEQWRADRNSAHQYDVLCWPLAKFGTISVFETMEKDPAIGPLNLLERNRLAEELKAGFRKRHFRDLLQNRWFNFWTALGYDLDYRVSRIADPYGRKPMAAGLLLLACAILLGKRQRFCLIVLSATHFLQLLAISFGGLVLHRYVNLTEPLLMYSFLLAGWTLLILLVKKLPISRLKPEMPPPVS